MAGTAAKLVEVEEWWPDDRARAHCIRSDDGLHIEASGTGRSCGGWQLKYVDATPDVPFMISLRVRQCDLPSLTDNVLCTVHWGHIDSHTAARYPVVPWDYLPLREDMQGLVFERAIMPPEGASAFTIRITLRWTPLGVIDLEMPRIAKALPRGGQRVKLSVVSGSPANRRRLGQSLEANFSVFSELCHSAAHAGSDLLVLPELAAHANLRGHPFDLANRVPGPVTELYGQVARALRCYLLVSQFEESGGAVFNSAVLLDRGGEVSAVFRKSHLAVSGENENGVQPSPSLRVSDIDFARVGCAICADLSFQEVTRVASLLGADLIMIPIEGDSRANRAGIGPSQLDGERWRAILRTRAMDNNCVLAVARNAAEGSCIVNSDGTVLAYNEGSSDFVTAQVVIGEPGRARNGGNPRDIQRMERRPQLFGDISSTLRRARIP